MSPEDLAEFEVSRDRAYALLEDAAAELRSARRPGGGSEAAPSGGLAAAALAEALMHISAAQDALDRMSG